MIVARWRIDARFGHKQAVLDLLAAWSRDIAPQIGWTADKCRLLTGSVGAREATVIQEWTLAGLGELEQAWAALGRIEAHKAWSKQLEPYVVSGSSRWEVWRILEPSRTPRRRRPERPQSAKQAETNA